MVRANRRRRGVADMEEFGDHNRVILLQGKGRGLIFG